MQLIIVTAGARSPGIGCRLPVHDTLRKIFGMPGAVGDVITNANFDEAWLRGFGVSMGLLLAFHNDLRRRHYNTLALTRQ